MSGVGSFPEPNVSARHIAIGMLGNIATSIWWWPGLAKALHALRGVRFQDRHSVFLGRDVLIDNRFPEGVSIGTDVWISNRCTILAHGYASQIQKREYGMSETTAEVVIEDGVMIGAGAIILPGARLGRGCFVVAGSVVAGTVPPGVMVAGNPARAVKALG